ncbi:Uncharacterised protein [Vibrio cholerae]|uniref:Uncharacterized protein n=1 Tax=Vibrio cholerae TaxID=666 RepID=A0A655PWD9_VIBCL|nr:Uncharacterised protein [Vibrio cholerae]
MWVHYRTWEITRAEHLFLQLFHIMADIQIVHFLTQLTDGVAFVTFAIRTVHVRQYFAQWCIFFNQAFKTSNLCH